MLGYRAVVAVWLVAACGSVQHAAGDAASGGSADAPARDAPSLAGWLYTDGGTIYVHDGTGGGTRWMGRGVNLDDIFLCGYNNTLYLASPDATLETIAAGLVADWKPTFVRISLGMASYTTQTSWLAGDAQYKTPMTAVIDALGANPGVYVLVTLRSDATMTGQDTSDGDPEATGLPSPSTDAVYTALVDTFATSPFVLFGLSNEPGGNKLTSAQIAAAMSHAVGTIRAEEDRLGVPHHLVSVQGNDWTSDISGYAAAPLPADNVVYEVHGYPPATASYTYANIPVILGEYGSLADSASFYADVEAKQVPNLAWDFEPYSDCSPDLLTVTTSATDLVPTAWGTTVKAYLNAH
ncbi:MAG TPA: cellulase family glycosylhydrolase [Kofleriaceae bacterium]|nr:cellulase family glycosylhydrolase [Kofleriaceae bacterium]